MTKYKTQATKCRVFTETADSTEMAAYYHGMAVACERHGSDMLELARLIQSNPALR